jgi:hypothetical protein
MNYHTPDCYHCGRRMCEEYMHECICFAIRRRRLNEKCDYNGYCYKCNCMECQIYKYRMDSNEENLERGNKSKKEVMLMKREKYHKTLDRVELRRAKNNIKNREARKARKQERKMAKMVMNVQLVKYFASAKTDGQARIPMVALELIGFFCNHNEITAAIKKESAKTVFTAAAASALE